MILISLEDRVSLAKVIDRCATTYLYHRYLSVMYRSFGPSIYAQIPSLDINDVKYQKSFLSLSGREFRVMKNIWDLSYVLYRSKATTKLLAGNPIKSCIYLSI